MATVVDALVVTLGLDLAAFKRGKADATKATKTLTAEEKSAAKEVEAANKRAADSFQKVRNEVLALVAIFTAGMGIKNFTESTINSAASLGFMAKNLQMSTQDLSAWQRAAERAGGSAEGITSALQASQQEVAKFKLGQVSDSQQWFLRFGGSVKDLKDGNSYLLARSRIVANLFKTDPGRARLVAQQMGIGDGEFNLIKQGPQAILALVAAQEKNSAITEKQAAQALKLKNEWLDFSDRLQYVGTTILLELMPVFEKWLQKLQAMADWVADHKADISAWVDNAVTAAQRFVEWADKAVDSVGGWKNVLIALAALKVLSMSSGILSLAGAFLKLGGALGGISATGAAALPILAKLLGVAGLALHSESLNEGEDAEIAKHRPKAGDTWQGDPIGDKRRGGVGKDPAAQAAVARFMQMGWSKEQASGLVANMWKESLLDPKAVGDNGHAYGIGQWHEDRQAEFKKLFGIDIRKSSLDQQLQFANYELTQGNEQGAGRRLRASTNALDAGAIVSRYYERPADTEGEARARARAASDLYASIGQANAAKIAGQTVGARDVAPVASNTSTSTTTAETNINGPITIHTQATDAHGIARELGGAVAHYSFTVPQANTGVS
ncbi:phage tail tip lysozyme [Paraburkholderia sp. RL17-373-BIF-A]|uniref:phage tail tip lysozyme n=1 Tax=Paraburkholderia sp. RL17-373-BIF-A TaxID=3031629 RepID=UPI0038BD9CC9